jgi:hypothetical protein
MPVKTSREYWGIKRHRKNQKLEPDFAYADGGICYWERKEDAETWCDHWNRLDKGRTTYRVVRVKVTIAEVVAALVRG